MDSNSKWLPQRKQDPHLLPLVCFPFAGGGGTVYHQWRFEPGIEVLPARLPGRESRFKEPALTDFDQLTESLMANLEPIWTGQYALFGHSLGALMAYDLAQRLTSAGQPPVSLFVSACRGPARLRRDSRAALHVLPNEEMIDGLIERYRMQVSRDEQALMLVFADTIRADLTLFHTYQPHNEPSLTCPVVACGGADDPVVTRADLEAWRAVTLGKFSSRIFPGGHFFIRTQHKPLAEFVQQKLQDIQRVR